MKLRRFTKRASIGLILVGVAAVFIVIGIFRDEVLTVLHKATAICMECIGIG